MKTKKPILSKAELEQQIEHWKWQTVALSEAMRPWLMIPGLIVYVKTDDLRDLDERLAILQLALKTLRK